MYFRFATLVALLSAQLALAANPNPFNVPQGGWTATAGKPLDLSWQPTTSGTVTLVLRNGASNNLNKGVTIASGIANDGSYTWTPAATLPRGSDYSIEIVDDADPTETNYSPYFVLNSSNTVQSTAATSSSSASSTSGTSSASSSSGTTSTKTNTSGSSSTMMTTSGSSSGSGKCHTGASFHASARCANCGFAQRLQVRTLRPVHRSNRRRRRTLKVLRQEQLQWRECWELWHWERLRSRKRRFWRYFCVHQERFLAILCFTRI